MVRNKNTASAASTERKTTGCFCTLFEGKPLVLSSVSRAFMETAPNIKALLYEKHFPYRHNIKHSLLKKNTQVSVFILNGRNKFRQAVIPF